MTIRLPQDLESSIRSLVEGGRFASEDELIAQAVRFFLRQHKSPTPEQVPVGAVPGDFGPDPLLGSMRDAADELDEIVADAMKKRQGETWRDFGVE